jgi:sigma-B regulation protein RsbU (phosphoserine phosphatase)
MKTKPSSAARTTLNPALVVDRRCPAGHNPPMFIRQDGRQRLDKGGPILGAFKDAVFDEGTVQLHPGDAVVVFSDGVTEAVNDDGEEFGENRLWECLEAHRHMPAADQLRCLFGASRITLHSRMM